MPDEHSTLEPHLPISNRTVKRWRADDSTDYPCESRSLSGTFKAKRPVQAGRFAWCDLLEFRDSGLRQHRLRNGRRGPTRFAVFAGAPTHGKSTVTTRR